MPLERLQKIISRAGVASRRHAEQMISSGQVTVNGKIVTELGSKADPGRDHIKVAGKLLQPPSEAAYFALNKPDGVVSTLQDPEGRPSLADLISRVPGRVYPIGRLPFHASGLLLLTNDGDLANRLIHTPRMQKWWLKIKGELPREAAEELDRRIGVKLRRVRSGPNAWYEAVVRNAHDDALRPALAEAGHPIEKIKRMSIGKIELGAMPPGAWRALTPGEIVELQRIARGEDSMPNVAPQRREYSPRRDVPKKPFRGPRDRNFRPEAPRFSHRSTQRATQRSTRRGIQRSAQERHSASQPGGARHGSPHSESRGKPRFQERRGPKGARPNRLDRAAGTSRNSGARPDKAGFRRPENAQGGSRFEKPGGDFRRGPKPFGGKNRFRSAGNASGQGPRKPREFRPRNMTGKGKPRG